MVACILEPIRCFSSVVHLQVHLEGEQLTASAFGKDGFVAFFLLDSSVVVDATFRAKLGSVIGARQVSHSQSHSPIRPGQPYASCSPGALSRVPPPHQRTALLRRCSIPLLSLN